MKKSLIILIMLAVGWYAFNIYLPKLADDIESESASVETPKALKDTMKANSEFQAKYREDMRKFNQQQNER